MSEAFGNILSLDTALGPACAGFLNTHNGKGASRVVDSEREQAKILIPLVEEVLKEAGVGFSQLDAVVTTVGPGSFTGLRLSLSAARTFATTLDIPVIGVTTLDAMAAQVQQEFSGKSACIVLETKRADFYMRCYGSDGRATGDMQAESAESITAQLHDKIDILAGNATARFEAEMKGAQGIFDQIVPVQTIDPVFLASLATQTEIHCDPMPVYLRGADVSQPKRVPRALSDA